MRQTWTCTSIDRVKSYSVGERCQGRWELNSGLAKLWVKLKETWLGPGAGTSEATPATESRETSDFPATRKPVANSEVLWGLPRGHPRGSQIMGLPYICLYIDPQNHPWPDRPSYVSSHSSCRTKHRGHRKPVPFRTLAAGAPSLQEPNFRTWGTPNAVADGPVACEEVPDYVAGRDVCRDTERESLWMCWVV